MSAMGNKQPILENKGVTVELLKSIDLGPEIEGMAGGVIGPAHDHIDRPGLIYVLQGTFTDHRDGVATEYGPGVGWPEDRNTVHWLENRGTVTAVAISIDIVRQ
jgi:quercetin dioxygenase-like cupin family protein